MEYFLHYIAKLKVEEYTLPLKCIEFIKMKKKQTLATQFITLCNTHCEEGKTEEKREEWLIKKGTECHLLVTRKTLTPHHNPP